MRVSYSLVLSSIWEILEILPLPFQVQYDGCCSVLEIMGVRLSPRTTSTTLGVRYLGVNTQLGTVQVQGYEFRKAELPQKSLPK